MTGPGLDFIHNGSFAAGGGKIIRWVEAGSSLGRMAAGPGRRTVAACTDGRGWRR